MHPKFADTESWERAQLLMQPSFIRLIDNIRKALDESDWTGTYEESAVWAEDVSEETKTRVQLLQQQLATASGDDVAELEQALARLPQPFLSYQLCLKKGDRHVKIDLWPLCYQICFRNYSPPFNLSDEQPVEIDTRLIDEETNDVDWTALDTKTKQIIDQLFANLPTVE